MITGASSGIGKALALNFAIEKANLVLAARSVEKLEEVKNECLKRGAECITVKTDVSSENDCSNLIEKAVAEFNDLDVLINNAGISMRALFSEMDVDVFEKVMKVNFWGAVYCTRPAMPHLLKSKGWVVGISSIAGFRGLPGRTAYSASKFAMNGFLEALRTENYQTGLKVLTACPGFTESNIRNTALTADGSVQKESPREESDMMTADEVAKEIIKAMKKQKHQLVLTRQGKMTVLLNKLANRFMDKMVFNHMRKEPGSPF